MEDGLIRRSKGRLPDLSVLAICLSFCKRPVRIAAIAKTALDQAYRISFLSMLPMENGIRMMICLVLLLVFLIFAKLF